MTVHMVRVASEFPDRFPIEGIRSVVQSWVYNHTEWVDDTVSHTVYERNTDPVEQTGVVYLLGDYRFEATDDKTAILDDAESTLQKHVAWYRLGYHVCYHDGQGDCSFTDQREYGNIPTGVPTFT